MSRKTHKEIKVVLHRGKAVASVRVVSAPGSLVTEKVFKLTSEADEQMRIRVDVPQVAAAHPE